MSPVDPQEFREQAIVQLTELANEAHSRATSKYLPTDVRQKWSRIATYVHQTANTVLKAYDGHVINEKLEELTRRVEELMEEAEEPEAGPGDAEHSGSEQGVPVLVPGYEW